MAYKVKYSPSAQKTIKKLDRPVQRRILGFIDKIEASNNPRFTGKALVGQDNQWRYRVGDYRIVCEIKDKELIVWVFRVGHRRTVYK